VCGLEDVPAHASVASRELRRDPGPGGPWFVGESVFEYVRPSPRDVGGYLATSAQGGRSQVRLGPPLEMVMPANEHLPSESLLRFGPPVAIAFRVERAGDYRVALVACPTTGAVTPGLELVALRDSVDAISTLAVDQLMFVGAPTRPRVEPLWGSSQREPGAGVAVRHDVQLEAGDVVRLSASGWPGSAGVLQVAFDLAIWPLATSSRGRPQDGAPR
jgi:hypothetical protein